MTWELLVGWILVGAILAAVLGPRQGWTPGKAALIGGIFGLFGVLFVLVAPAVPAKRKAPSEWDKLADDYEAWRAAGEPDVNDT